jgi:F-type H+-transporting ATPase subunit delta
MAVVRVISPATRRYAAVFFEAAQAEGQADALLGAWQLIRAALESDPAVEDLLRDPGVSAADKERVLARLPRQPWPAAIASGVAMVLRSGRVEVLHEMDAAIQQLLDAAQGVLRVQVRSARPLRPQALQRLQRFLEQRERKRLQISTELDPQLIGGVQVVLDYRVIDGSLRRQLQDLHQFMRQVRVH